MALIKLLRKLVLLHTNIASPLGIKLHDVFHAFLLKNATTQFTPNASAEIYDFSYSTYPYPQAISDRCIVKRHNQAAI